MNKRLELNETEVKLLIFSAGDLIPELLSNKDLIYVKQSAFDYYDPESKEAIQVQILVTRSESDKLEPFQTEEMSTYKP